MVFPLSLCFIQIGTKSGHLSDLYLQPSYEMLPLLLQEFWHKYPGNMSITSQSHSERPEDDKDALKWKFANQFYFRNLASMQQLKEICLGFSKDLSLEQVSVLAI